MMKPPHAGVVTKATQPFQENKSFFAKRQDLGRDSGDFFLIREGYIVR
jgi:hypothetical protein